MRARHLEAAGADGNENGQARQHWAKYAAVSHRTKVKNFIQKKLVTAIRVLRLEAAGTGNYENWQTRQHWVDLTFGGKAKHGQFIVCNHNEIH